MSLSTAERIQCVPFETAAVVTKVDSHTYKANVHLDYSHRAGAHGGYLNSLVLRTTTAHFKTTLGHTGQLDTISFHIEYLRPATVGEVILKVKDAKIGKASSTIHVSLSQGGKVKAEAYATNINQKANANGMTIPTGYSTQSQCPLPPIDFDKVLSLKDRNWLPFDFPNPKDRHLANIIIALPKELPSDQAFSQQWIAPSRPEERWTTHMLGLVVDHIKPIPETLKPESRWNDANIIERSLQRMKEGKKPEMEQSLPPYGYMTTNMTLDFVHPLPEDGAKWLLVKSRTKSVWKGRYDVNVEAWDAEGRLIALSQQLWTMIDMGAGQPQGKVSGPGSKI